MAHKLASIPGEGLVKALGLPLNTIGFNLRFRVDRIPTITVQYYPETLTIDDDDEIISEIKRYELREITDK